MGVTNIRLARFGHRNNPFFRLVAIDSRKKLSAGPIEYVRCVCVCVCVLTRAHARVPPRRSPRTRSLTPKKTAPPQ